MASSSSVRGVSSQATYIYWRAHSIWTKYDCWGAGCKGKIDIYKCKLKILNVLIKTTAIVLSSDSCLEANYRNWWNHGKFCTCLTLNVLLKYYLFITTTCRCSRSFKVNCTLYLLWETTCFKDWRHSVIKQLWVDREKHFIQEEAFCFLVFSERY